MFRRPVVPPFWHSVNRPNLSGAIRGCAVRPVPCALTVLCRPWPPLLRDIWYVLLFFNLKPFTGICGLVDSGFLFGFFHTIYFIAFDLVLDFFNLQFFWICTSPTGCLRDPGCCAFSLYWSGLCGLIPSALSSISVEILLHIPLVVSTWPCAFFFA